MPIRGEIKMKYRVQDVTLDTVNNDWRIFRTEFLMFLDSEVKKRIQSSQMTIQEGWMEDRYYKGLNIRFHFGTSLTAKLAGKQESFINLFWSESQKLFSPIITPSNNLKRPGRKTKEIITMINKFGFKKLEALKKSMADQENIGMLKARRDKQVLIQETENKPILGLLFQVTLNHEIKEICARHGIEFLEAHKAQGLEEQKLEHLKETNLVKWSQEKNRLDEKWEKRFSILKGKFRDRIESTKTKKEIYNDPSMIEVAHQSNIREINRDYQKKMDYLPILQGRTDLKQASKPAKIEHDRTVPVKEINTDILQKAEKQAQKIATTNKGKSKTKTKRA